MFTDRTLEKQSDQSEKDLAFFRHEIFLRSIVEDEKMWLPKILATLYVFTTNTVASKKKQYYLARRHRRRNSKELKNVFTKEEYVEFVDLAYRDQHEEMDMGTVTWAMGLSKRAKVS